MSKETSTYNRYKSLHMPCLVNHEINQSITMDKFSRLTSNEQSDIRATTALYYPIKGSTDVDDNFVLPQCRNDLHFSDLVELAKSKDEKIANACREVAKTQKYLGRPFNLKDKK